MSCIEVFPVLTTFTVNTFLPCVTKGSTYTFTTFLMLLIHSADPQSDPVMITIITRVVRLSIRIFKIKLNKANLHCLSNCGLAEWIIDDSCLVFLVLFC